MEKQKLIYVESKALFSPSSVSNKAIVFIKDTKEIWTHGTYFICSNIWATPITLTLSGDSTGSVSIDGSKGVTLTTNNKYLTGVVHISDYNDAAPMFSQKLVYCARIVSSSVNGFPMSNNANAVLAVNTHDADYTHQLGFSSNKGIYHRTRTAGTWETSWRELLTSTNYTKYPHTFASLTNKPTTISGYGITDSIPIIKGGRITTDTDLSTLGMTTYGAKLSVFHSANDSNPNYMFGYSNALMFRSTLDTYAAISIDFSSATVTFIGGRNAETAPNNVPNWWFRIKGNSGTTYDLNSFLNIIGNYVTLSTDLTVSGKKLFNNQLVIRKDVGDTGAAVIDQQHDLQLQVMRSSNTHSVAIGVMPTGAGVIWAKANGIGYNTLYLNPYNNGVAIGCGGNGALPNLNDGHYFHIFGSTLSNNSITATKFIKSGGTASQFLKADGSLDSTSYLSLSGGTMAESGYIAFPASANSSVLSNNTPMGITYGRILSYGTLTIAGDTDGSKTEFVNIVAGRNISEATAANGLSIGYNTLKWKGTEISLSDHNHDSQYLKLSGGTMTGNITWNTDSHGIYFYGGCGIEKWSGYGPTLIAEINTDFYIRNNTDRTNYHKIIHAGNYSSYALPLSGGTMTGALNFVNNTWNKVGDDAYMGDCNVGGMIGIKSANRDTPGFAMYNSGGTLLGKLYASGTSLYWSDAKILTASGTSTLFVMGDGSLYSDTIRYDTWTKTTTSGIAWFPIADVTDYGQGTALFMIRAYAHSSIIFTVVKGYSNGNINVLAGGGNFNNDYAYIRGVRLVSTVVEIGLNAAATKVNILVKIILPTYAYSLRSSLVESTNTTTPYVQYNINSGGNYDFGIISSKFTGNLIGNADTASKWKDARTITLTGDVTGSVSLDGSSNVTLTTSTSGSGTSTFLKCPDKRNLYPALIVTSGGNIGAAFTSASTLGLSEGSHYEAVILRGWIDSSGGNDNALLFSKNTSSVYHSQYDFGSTTTWGTLYKFLDSNNYSSYALPLSGGTMTGVITLTSGADSAAAKTALSFIKSSDKSEQARIGTDVTNGLGIYAKGTIFIRPNVALDNVRPNGLAISSSSFTYNGNAVLTSSNYTNYTIGYANALRNHKGYAGVISDGKLYYNNTLQFARFVQHDNSGRFSYELIAELTNYGTGTNTSYITYGISGFMWALREGNGANSGAYPITAIVNVGPAVLLNMLRVPVTTDALIPFVVKYNDKYYIALRKNGSSTTFYFMGIKLNLLTTTIIVNDASLIEEIAGPIAETSTASKFYNNGNPQEYLHAGNYSSYALPLTGGKLTGKLTMKANSIDNLPLIYRTDAAYISGIRFLNTLGYLGAIGMNAVSGSLYILDTANTAYTILDSRNYNNYSPTLTGTGATGTWGISISGTANKVANALTLLLNGGTTSGTNKFIYDGSAAYTVNITPDSIGAATSSHNHDGSYLKLSGGTLGSSSQSETNLYTLSSTAKLRLLSYSDSTNYILSGNSEFTGNATLKITGYNNVTGTNLYFKFNNIYCRDNDYINIDSGNYSSYALPLSGGTMTGTINCKAIVPITDNGYSIGTSSKTLYEIHANFFKRRGSSNDYVLLGGGEHKLISDFVLNYTAVVPGGSVGNNDSWTLILNNNYSTGWYNPCTMFYIRSHNFGCGILCFYHYWNTELTSGYYDNSVWFFGAEHSAYSGTMGGTGRDINNFLKVYIDKDNDNLKIYYNRYNNLGILILELLFSLHLAGTLYPKGLIRASHFITNGAVTDLPITSNTFVNIPILTAKNHTEDIKTTRSVYASAFYENSDIRLKENVHSIDLIDLLKNVDLVQFNFKNDLNKKYGVIAQQLEQVGLNNLVYEHNGNKAVDYISLLVLETLRLRNEIKELKEKLDKKELSS